MKIVVVHTKRSNHPNTINVGRPSVLGNPFSHLSYVKHVTHVPTVEDAVQHYKSWLIDRIADSQPVRSALNHIINVGQQHGTVHLACWCKDETKPYPSDHVCHADVIRNAIMTHLSEQEST